MPNFKILGSIIKTFAEGLSKYVTIISANTKFSNLSPSIHNFSRTHSHYMTCAKRPESLPEYCCKRSNYSTFSYKMS